MVVQTLTSIIYQITQESWAFASIILKYYLIAAIIYLYTEKGLTAENFRDKVLEDSRFVLTGIVLAGAVIHATRLEISPLVKILSEGIALAYLAYLFWEY
jgi:hypothetical protein